MSTVPPMPLPPRERKLTKASELSSDRWPGEDEQHYRARMVVEAIALYEQKVIEAAEFQRTLRHDLATGWPIAPGRTEGARKDWVEDRAADAEYMLRLAEGLVRSAMELVKMRQESYSQLRTEMATKREEAKAIGGGAYVGAR